ncbi:hypothetical protein LMB49_10670 [Limosilactobacillus reuteri]|uniref:hypothetical protein n=1 Tax=Limosilactobacillus reuteri TaxID=1598 RepID=UPI001E28EB84|nr:hypothetical protein [Limosilactobacillus reuteri]MCC4370576.1 hypothetical protein [Limosilactobacillus reuteri]MCC4371855.1 hypothetical protein [Limosilactobacillus reuteri]MCC4509327.1 hypothetical protein [Limosilactobacillus reuteri]MCC4509370.1 hypothetical protein [Limosilactobacillus reuteri]
MFNFNHFILDDNQITREITKLIPRMDRLPKSLLTAKRDIFRMTSTWSIDKFTMILPTLLKSSKEKELTLFNITLLMKEIIPLTTLTRGKDYNVMEFKMGVGELQKLVKEVGIKQCYAPVIVLESSYDTKDAIFHRKAILYSIERYQFREIEEYQFHERVSQQSQHDFNYWIYDEKTQNEKYYPDVNDFLNDAAVNF